MNVRTTDPRSTPQSDAPVCGVVVYQVGDVELRGRWTVNTPSFSGMIGTEVATGGEPGVLPGVYDVTIFDSHGKEIYAGGLTISAVGDTYTLSSRSAAGDYDGVGLTQGDEFVASYWQAV